MYPLITGLVVLGASLWAAYMAPSLWHPFIEQQNAFYLLSVGLALLSMAPFHQIPEKGKALLKISGFVIIVGAGVWSFMILGKWIQSFIEVYFKYRQRLSASDALIAFYRLLVKKGNQMGYIWLGWVGTSAIIIAPIMSYAKSLFIDSFKDLFKRSLKSTKNKDLEEGPWQGGFMEPSKVKMLTTQKTGMALGIVPSKFGWGSKIARFKEDDADGWIGGHHLIVSATRGGKGVSCVLPAILDHQGPIIVLDVKAELFVMTRRYRQSLGRKVMVLNPFNMIEKNRIHWNPLDYIRDDPEYFEEDVAVVVDGLVEPDFGKNGHFSDTAIDILRAAIGILKQGPKEKFNLVELYKMLFSKELVEVLKDWRDKPDLIKGRATELANEVINTILGTAKEESGGFGTTLKRKISWIRLQNCEEFLQKSDFSLESVLDNKIDIYCVIPLKMLRKQGAGARGLMRLFTNLMMGTVSRNTGVKNAKAPILMLLDEFTRLGYMEEISNIITTGAGAGLELFMAVQDRGSVEKIWEDETDSLIANAATTRIFNLGRGDGKTAEWVSSLMGDVTRQTLSKSSSSSDKSEQTGESLNQTKDKLLSPVEILEMNHKMMVCLLRGHKPLMLKRIISHKHSQYKRKLDKNVTLLERKT